MWHIAVGRIAVLACSSWVTSCWCQDCATFIQCISVSDHTEVISTHSEELHTLECFTAAWEESTMLASMTCKRTILSASCRCAALLGLVRLQLVSVKDLR